MDKQFRKICTLVLVMGFLLGIRDGKLTLWRDGRTQPEQVYDIRADSLPPADQLQLRRGIRVEDREQLWLILENYLD
jgi:hypothetical protein